MSLSRPTDSDAVRRAREAYARAPPDTDAEEAARRRYYELLASRRNA